jgi:hypothetical protein
VQIQRMPIVQSGALEITVFGGKSERANEMKRRADARAGARDVARVDVDFRFDQNDVHKAECVCKLGDEISKKTQTWRRR